MSNKNSLDGAIVDCNQNETIAFVAYLLGSTDDLAIIKDTNNILAFKELVLPYEPSYCG